MIRWKGTAAAPAPAPAPAPAAAAAPAAAPAAAAAPAGPTGFAADPTKVLCSIVSAYREGTAWVLYLDKGAAAKIRQGMTGNVLDGPEGDKLLDGASLTVSQVTDDNKAIARSSFAKSLGKNKRVVLNLK
jgi:hypothetical protein